MRILVKINGKPQVDEIWEIERQNLDNSIMLWAPDEMQNIQVTGVSDLDYERIVRELLVKGYADLSEYPAAYDNDEESEDDEDSDPDGTQYQVTCACGTDIAFDDEILMKGSIQCPVCGELLEFSLKDEETPLANKPQEKSTKRIFHGLFSGKENPKDPWEM